MHRVYNPSNFRSPCKSNNPSLEYFENIMKLPKLNKVYKLDFEDNDFKIQYYENRNRVELTYRQKEYRNIEEDKIKNNVTLQQKNKMRFKNLSLQFKSAGEDERFH